MPKPKKKKTTIPPEFMQVAQSMYGDSFGAQNEAEIGEALLEFNELDDNSPLFYVGHLLYLNLQAQAMIVRRLERLIRLSEEGVDILSEVREGDGDEDETERDDGARQADEVEGDDAADEEADEPEATAAPDDSDLPDVSEEVPEDAEVVEPASRTVIDVEPNEAPKARRGKGGRFERAAP